MIGLSCPRETEVVRVARTGALPPAGSELADHVAGCTACAEAVAFAAAFRAERDAAGAGAHVPAAGLVWWKAELRNRLEQAEAASRPIVVAHAIALVALVATVAALGSWLAPRAEAILRGLAAWPRPPLGLPLPSLDLASIAQPGVLLAAAAALVLAPLALYLAFSRE
jgi:hypothetical protein